VVGKVVLANIGSYSGCVLIEIPAPDPRGYTEIVTPSSVRRAVKLALYAELAEDLICQPPFASASL
jgi:hypothetical protein